MGPFAPLFLLYAMTSAAKKGSPPNAPVWPGTQHPPPSRLPGPVEPTAAPTVTTHVHAPAPARQHRKKRRHGRGRKRFGAHRHATPRPRHAIHKGAGVPVIEPPPMPHETVPAKRDAIAAARDLYDYVRTMVGKHQASLLGTRAHPNAFVADAQRDMGVRPDGIYGPATRKRGKALLGRTFPARVAGDDRPLYIP